MNKHASAFYRWPAGRFFWAVLEAPGVLRPGPLPESLLVDLADELPVPVEEVYAVATPSLPVAPHQPTGAPKPERRLLVCAVRRAELEPIAKWAAAFYPDSIPAELGVLAEPASLNFLVGEFEPRPARVARFKLHALRSALVLLAAALVTTGLYRRAGMYSRIEQSARGQVPELVAAVMPGASEATIDLTLDQELARLRGRVKDAGSLAVPPDAALVLAELLKAWPAQVPSSPQAIAVSPTGVAASVSLEGDPSPFLRALKPPAGWTLDEPRMNATAGITRVSLQMRPAREPRRLTP